MVCVRKRNRVAKGEREEQRQQVKEARALQKEQHSWKAVAAQAHALAQGHCITKTENRDVK